MNCTCITLIVAQLVLGLTAFGACAESARYEFVHSLQKIQEQALNGSAAARIEQTKMLDRMQLEFAVVPTENWSQPRNSRALVVYLVNGGSTTVVRKLLATGVEFGANHGLILALVAFADKEADAAVLLAKFDARSFDVGIGAPLALAQGIAHLAEPAKALPYLALARLLAPGTLIDEAALRREITVLLAANKNSEALALGTRYLWRFSGSIYAADVASYLGGAVLPGLATAKGDMQGVRRFLDELPEPTRRSMLLTMADEGMLDGKLELVEFASAFISQLSATQSAEQTKVKLYRAICNSFMRRDGTSTDELVMIDRAQLGDAERGLLDASLTVTANVKAYDPNAPGAMAVPEDEIPGVIALARMTISAADQILAEAMQ